MTLAAFFIEHLFSRPLFFFSVVVTVVFSIILHELAHGVAAIWQGDDTPRASGHMTLDPLVHMGGFSLILLLAVGIAYGMMPVNPSRFRSRHGAALVAGAGPLSNFLLALAGATILGLWLRLGGVPENAFGQNTHYFLRIFSMINVVLFCFNLLPVPPLDGSAILCDFSPSYRRLTRNPQHQLLFLALFLVIFISVDFFGAARDLVDTYVRWIMG